MQQTVRVAAAMKALAAVASPVVSARARPRCCFFAGASSAGGPCQSGLQHSSLRSRRTSSSSVRQQAVVMMMARGGWPPAAAAARIQFIQGTDEQTVPDVRLTKSRDGSNGVAIFTFNQPSVFESSAELGDITGFYMVDEEGTLQSVDVSAKFVNGKPVAVEAKYVMRTSRDWDKFMRFMERYSQANGLQFVNK